MLLVRSFRRMLFEGCYSQNVIRRMLFFRCGYVCTIKYESGIILTRIIYINGNRLRHQELLCKTIPLYDEHLKRNHM